MTQHSPQLDQVRRQVQQTARQAANNPWVEKLARFGYAAKGVVYFIVGVLAAEAAFGVGGKTTDTKGALQTIVTQPFGKILLALVTIGLLGYVVWRFVEVVEDPEHRESGAKNIGLRLGYALSGLAYAGLALTAVRLLMGMGGANGNTTRDWTARLMGQPFGRWLVVLAGLGVVGFGLYQFYKAYAAKLSAMLKWNEMSAEARTWVVRLGRAGLAARGIVFVIIGGFLAQAGLRSNPGEVQGLGGALETLARQRFGPWLLGIVALGLAAYGVYQLAMARYRRIIGR
jgi:hypothetical protein